MKRTALVIGTVIVTGVSTGCTHSMHSNHAGLYDVSPGALDDGPSVANASYYPLGAGDAFGWMIFQPERIADAPPTLTLRNARFTQLTIRPNIPYTPDDYRTYITLGHQR